ncbi:MAG: hypothetical protein QNJ47_01265 [Nostocaceae cyanobacterium]|nr:hypothetical protein [Nostocaceae cyanobacterium]
MYVKLPGKVEQQIVAVDIGSVTLMGELTLPPLAQGIVVFAEGNGCSLNSSHHRYLAHMLAQERLATMLIDLLTTAEQAIDLRSKHCCCNIRHLAARLARVTDWLGKNPITRDLQIGYFGDRIGGGVALLAGCQRPQIIKVIVVCSGLTDLVGSILSQMETPTLLIVGEYDLPVIAMNEDTLAQIPTQNKCLKIIADATHNFGEPGAIEAVAKLTIEWFQHYLTNTNKKSSLPISNVAELKYEIKK